MKPCRAGTSALHGLGEHTGERKKATGDLRAGRRCDLVTGAGPSSLPGCLGVLLGAQEPSTGGRVARDVILWLDKRKDTASLFLIYLKSALHC